MKSLYKVIFLFIFTSIASFSFGQIGAGCNYTVNSHTRTTITYCKDGYYEGSVVNIGDLVTWTKGSSSYELSHCSYTINGVEVASNHTYRTTPPDYYLSINKTTEVTIRIGERIRANASTQYRGDYVLRLIMIPLEFNPPLQVCLDAPRVNLRNHIRSTSGAYTSGGFPLGVFSGTGVTGSNFYPSTAGVGSHTITFTNGEKVITKTIQVVAPATITENFPSTVYNTDKSGSIMGRLDLRSYVNQSGGSFEVTLNGSNQTLLDGRYLNLFNIISETDYSTTSRNIVVKYTYTNGPCTQVKTKTITVKNNNINISVGDFPDICANGQEYDFLELVNTISPSGGVFTASGGLRLYGENGRNFLAERDGSFPITYTVTQNGYSKSITKHLRIREIPEVTFNRVSTVCSTSKIDLTSYVQPQGGTFSGPGIRGNEFNPSDAGIGEHTITYSFSNDYGCTATTTAIINVLELIPGNVTFEMPENICQDAGTILLTNYVSNHEGGTFSGLGVTGNYLDVSLAGTPGIKTITYKIKNGSCNQDFTSTYSLKQKPPLVFNNVSNICYSASVINLVDYVEPKGGTFSGIGVVEDRFFPQTAGKGAHVVTYSYTDALGCSNEISKTIMVAGLIPNGLHFRDLPTVCSQSEAINLREYVNTTEGTFSGRGVTGDVFNPTAAGANTHQITFTYKDDNCTQTLTRTITVQSETTVNFNTIPTVCYKTRINLMSYVGSHTGGTFYGPGVVENYFYPEVAGKGNHVVSYSYSNTVGCVTNVSQTIRVDDLINEDITFSSIPNKCVNSPSVFLRDYIFGAGTTSGTFSGRGVTGEYFNPAAAGVGTWTISWEEKNGNCTNTKTTTVIVSGNPPVVFNTLPKICYQDEVLTLSSYTPSPYNGGIFSGPGVIDGEFHAEQAGVGTHTINYVFQQGDCQVLKQQTVVVGGLLNSSATFNVVEGICVSGPTIDLNDYVNVSGGIFAGPGVTGTFFNPSAAGVGLKKVTYTLTHGTCSEVHEQVIDVQGLTAFTFDDLPIICSSTPVYLNNYIRPFREGGTFVGRGVVDNVFYPETAGIGQHLITFSYTNSYGCETLLTKPISVDQLLGEISFKEISNLCKTSSPIYLPDYIDGHSGGTFSGQGVNGEYFNPGNVNPGAYTIKYKVTGGRCNEEISTVIIVSEGPNVSFNTIPPICFDRQINLYNYVSHTGINAVFSGPGVNGNFFDPSQAGRGLHTITYGYRNALGCETVLTQVVNVVDLLQEVVFDDLPSICESSSAVILSDYIQNHSGGIFSGPGVQGNVFNPKTAGEGLHLITYTISNGSCFIEIQKNIEVFPQESVTFNPVNDLCFISKVDLTRYVSPAGGVFSGIGIDGNEFNPLKSGIGSFLIEYTFTSSNGCETVAKQTINVVDLVELDITFNSLPEICENGATLYLPDFVDHEGGTFSGRGVTGNYFNPAVAGKGSHLITYLIAKGDCKIEVQEVVHVFPPDEIVFSTIPNVCYDAPINLQNYVSPQGGIFSGSGVEDGFFYPANVGLGDYTISYQYINAKGCLSTATRVVKVINLLSSNITFSALPEVCPESSVINLRDYVNSLEGEFVGRGVTDGYFDPKVAGAGVHKIEFRIINGACRTERFQSIIVKQPVAITFEKVPEICAPNTIDLSSFVVPKGGQFAGNGVTGNMFDPSIAGVGSHEITYLLNDGSGCVNQIKQTLTVTNLIPESLAFNRISDVCTNSNSIKLSDYLSHNLPEGSFSGPGVSGEYFNPSIAGKGVHQISFTIGQGNCRTILKETITVKGKDDNVIFHTLPEVCINKQIDLADYISKHIGQFSGVGVQSNKFNPGVAGIGTHTISYLYENELGCEFVLTQDIVVRDLMPANIAFSALPEVCPDNGAIKLSDYVNYSGTFSGAGVNGEYFNPSNVNPGTYTINFTFSNGICQGTKKQIITVKNREEVFFSSILPICKDKAIDLTQYVFPQGGTFSGPGISGNTFYPSLAGTGKHVITYRYVNALNCPSVIQKEIEVLEMINSDIQFSALPDICVNSSPVKLSEFLKNADLSGKFIGTGVEGEYFNPLTAGPGAWTITYEVGNITKCKESYVQTLVVHSNDSVKFTTIPATCTQSPVNLFDFVTHKTGSFSGPGVQENIFYPALAGTGNHMIVYNYKSHSGCESVLTRTVNVPRIYSNVTFNPIGEVCQNSSAISLSSFVNVSGGNFSGPGVENNMFNPSIAKGGSHQITYTIGNESCQVQTTEMITVISVPEIVFDDLPDLCFDEVIRLDNYVSHQGVFSGRGVEDNIFDPSQAGQGVHKITFSYNENGCSVSITKTINVLSLNNPNIEFFKVDEMCVNASSIDLSMYTNAKGNFSGPGVQGNIFNPLIAGAGTHELVLNVGQGSCLRQYRQYVTVYDTTPLEVRDVVICNGQSIDLNNYVNIQGGVFSGQGIGANYFYPERLGQFNVQYSYQNRNGCNSSVSFLVNVNGMHPENIEFLDLPALCSYNEALDLRKYVSFYNESSVFSGKGVQGYFFSPSTAGVGVHQITYTNGTGSCRSTLTKTIQVNAPTQVDFNLPASVCNEASFDLENLTNVQGPSFTGPGVSSNSFYPASAGIGSHRIILTYENSSNCQTTIQKSIEVKALNPKNVGFIELPDVCVNQSRIKLSEFVSDPQLAVFSGAGVNGQYFYPSQAGPGTHTITCKIGLVSGCVDSYKQIINVLDLPQVTFNSLPDVCFDSPITLANYVSLEGGFFAGPGISDGIFYPSQAEQGDHQISYIIQDDNGCESVLTQTLSVRSLCNPAITFSSLPNVCVNAENVNLLDYVSEFVGSFSGPGITNTIFSASEAGVGTHAIKYTVGTGSCAREFTQYISVYPLANVEFSTLPIICYNTEINLEDYVTPQGGTFTGSGVSGQILNTESLEIGTYTITYNYQDGNGCLVRASQILEVSGKNPLENTMEFSSLPDVCLGSSPIDLRNFVSAIGGTFSGQGVTGSLFNPSAAGVGVHLVTYTFGVSQCQMNFTQEIIVKNAPTISFLELPQMCNLSDEINLSNYVSHQGGVFSGMGVEDGVLKRSLLSKGNTTIYYTYITQDGCTLELSQTLPVGDIVPENLVFETPGEVCENGGSINLFTLVNSSLGTFTGAGIDENGFFQPSLAGKGTHRITYTIGQGMCQNIIHKFITVTPSKTIDFSIPEKVCGKDPISLMEYVNYKGGSFLGTGVVDDVFYPESAGEGIHRITYIYRDELCEIQMHQNLEVLNTRNLAINVDKSSVNSSALVKFWTEGFDIQNYKWEFGDGGYSLEKEPFHYYYHTGTFDVTLICEDSNGCEHIISKEDFITVSAFNETLKRSVIEINDLNAKVGTHYFDADLKTDEDYNVEVYPNPFADFLKISSLPRNKELLIEILDITGKVVFYQKVENADEITIYPGQLATGVYIIKIDEKTKKIIKK